MDVGCCLVRNVITYNSGNFRALHSTWIKKMKKRESENKRGTLLVLLLKDGEEGGWKKKSFLSSPLIER
jgi:hypothetical protein